MHCWDEIGWYALWTQVCPHRRRRPRKMQREDGGAELWVRRTGVEAEPALGFVEGRPERLCCRAVPDDVEAVARVCAAPVYTVATATCAGVAVPTRETQALDLVQEHALAARTRR